MLSLPGDPRIFLFNGPTDMRKGFEGLLTLVESYWKETPNSGNYFAFLNRSRDRIKILYWDGDGLVIWYKRLEKGSFPKNEQIQPLISRQKFLMMLEEVTPKKVQNRYKLPCKK